MSYWCYFTTLPLMMLGCSELLHTFFFRGTFLAHKSSEKLSETTAPFKRSMEDFLDASDDRILFQNGARVSASFPLNSPCGKRAPEEIRILSSRQDLNVFTLFGMIITAWVMRCNRAKIIVGVKFINDLAADECLNHVLKA